MRDVEKQKAWLHRRRKDPKYLELLRERMRRYRQANPERYRAINRKSGAKYRSKNRKRINEYMRSYYAANASHREYVRRMALKYTHEVTDAYVRRLLTVWGIAPESITPELIEAKRLHIKLDHKLKEMRNGS